MTVLLVSELFGPTLQGEGPSTGRPAMFVRLGLCNLACSWCDTPYTWDWEGRIGQPYDRDRELTHRTADEVLAWACNAPAQLVVITGGEPMVQQSRLPDLIVPLISSNRTVEIETNGTLPPSPTMAGLGDLNRSRLAWNVSPKLDHAGHDRTTIHPDVLAEYAGLSGVLKVVCRTVEDVERTARIATAAGYSAPRVWVMPEGRTLGQVLDTSRLVADSVIGHGFNLSQRLHVALWGSERVAMNHHQAQQAVRHLLDACGEDPRCRNG